MALTGRRDGPALFVTDRVTAAIESLAERVTAGWRGAGVGIELDGLALLGERAALAGLTRSSPFSCGGATKLIRAADAVLAVCMARSSDVESVPAWLECAVGPDPWVTVERECRHRCVDELVERAQLLGMAVAAEGSIGHDADRVDGIAATRLGDAPSRCLSELVVVDLSSLWAGPLCAHLLGLAGARVIKVESANRPDGARRGPSGFVDLLHGGHESVALDLRSARGVSTLRSILAAADVVIEGSRPRALEQLGIVAEEMTTGGDRPQMWVSVTAYGRRGHRRDWVGFGDDAAVAGGLVARELAGATGDPRDSQTAAPERALPCFVADAVGDPCAGLAAAAAALERLATGGTWLLDVSMAHVSAALAAGFGCGVDADVTVGADPTEVGPVAIPRARHIAERAAPIGAHTDAVLAELRSGVLAARGRQP
jgi:hypothetical protein